MPRFAANLTMLFNEVDFLDRYAAAQAAGFKGVEYLFPYPYAPEALAGKLARHGLTQVLHNLPAGDWASGERGIACLPGREAEFRDGVSTAIRYARALNCGLVNCLVGVAPKGVDDSLVRSTLVGNLRYAARALADAGIKLLVEPINNYDIPGFYLSRSRQTLELFDEVGESNLWLQYDIYHMQRSEGELAATLQALLPRIAHVQIADNPGRNEPGTGEINYDYLFRRLDEIGYPGWVGCEYKPRASTRDGLGWLARAGAR
ncbi:MAG: hydroxypyruvate isomerase [Pseudomonadota bacterium]|nr:hydroxypyruvate isomerase [Pseudomonadota bacterium]